MEEKEMQRMIAALADDPEFIRVVAGARDPGELKAFFQTRDLELPDDYAKEVFDQIGLAMRDDGRERELSEKELEYVAGGSVSMAGAGYLAEKIREWLTGRKKDRKPARTLGPRPMDEIPRKPRP